MHNCLDLLTFVLGMENIQLLEQYGYFCVSRGDNYFIVTFSRLGYGHSFKIGFDLNFFDIEGSQKLRDIIEKIENNLGFWECPMCKKKYKKQEKDKSTLCLDCINFVNKFTGG